MNYRLTIISAVAVVLSSFSLITVIDGLGWLYAGIGAAVVVALAGLATRMAPIPAAAVATALTLIVVAPLLATPTWAARISAVAFLALVAASAGVRRVLPALADVVTYLAALLIYLTLVFAHAQAAAWLVPTAASLRHLGHLASQGYALHQFAPPVPSIRGIELIAAAGIGLVAVLTDLLAVRLNSPAVAGLPLLVLFSVPVATNVKHVGFGLTLSFCLGISGYLALLAADGRQRLRLWGRLVTVWQDDDDDEDDTARGPDTRQLAASGRRVGLAAVAFAIVLPLILPGLREHGIFGGKSNGPGHGALKVAPPQPLVQMRGQLFDHSSQPVLTYHTTAANPREQYLRVYVLNYDGSSGQWNLAGRGPVASVTAQQLAPPPGLAAKASFVTAQTTVTINKNAGYKSSLSYLPVPYAPQYLRVPGSGWVETKSTLMVYGYRPDAGLRYTVISKTPQVIQSQLPARAKLPDSVRPYMFYPGPDRQKLLAIARNLTKDANTPFAKALALQNWFTEPGNFTYTLRGAVPGNVYDFVTTQRRGFCQQFAFAMAVMARLLGIPARIAVGYTAGTRAAHGTWRVTTADAHAWPELYFPTIGWTRFEPTPGGPAAQGTAAKPDYPTTVPVLPPPGQTSTGPQSPISGQSSNPAAALHNLRPGTGPTGPGSGHAGSGSGFPVGLVLAILAGVLLIGPGTTRVLTRRRRWLAATGDAGRAHAAWRELTSDLTDYGLSVPLSESPRAVSRRVGLAGGLDDAARAAIGRISAAEERARYARAPADGATLQADVLTVRRAVARNAGQRQRWRARLMPATTRAPVLAALRQAPDIFGWMDAAGLRIRRTVRTRARSQT